MAQKANIQEEVLEQVWNKKEEGLVLKEELLTCENPKITRELLERMIKDDYLYEEKGKINLTKKGHGIAYKIIRSHRLAERLFVDILEQVTYPLIRTKFNVWLNLSKGDKNVGR